MCGDLVHSPIQCLFPDWRPWPDWDPAQAAATRRAFLDRHGLRFGTGPLPDWQLTLGAGLLLVLAVTALSSTVYPPKLLGDHD